MGASANISLNKIAQNLGLVNPFCKKNLQYSGRNLKLRKFQPDLVDRKGGNGYDEGTSTNPAHRHIQEVYLMNLGEKLQQLRKQSGLSQEQLAARLTVSRQAVSKWELDETMPDTENVVQLSRLFGVSCDYLLRDEVDKQGALLPAAPGEIHLDEPGWIHNAFALSLGVCAFGLVTGFLFYRFGGHTVRPLVVGFMIQMLSVVLFELATPRMGGSRNTARFHFYGTVCWLLPPFPVIFAINWIFELRAWMGTPLRALTYYFAAYLLLSVAATAILTVLRRRAAKK